MMIPKQRRENAACACDDQSAERKYKQDKKTQTELIVHKPKDKIVTDDDDDASPLPSLCEAARLRP